MVTTDVPISIVTLLDDLIESAYHLHASDIHIDPTAHHTRVRLRVDGVLHDTYTLPQTTHHEIISRIKVLARLRTDEHQMAQDGRFRHSIQDKHIDIRVSIAPTYHGENTVMRLLAEDSDAFTLSAMGFSENDQAKILHALKKQTGMILATGPTGSGKTTTLYTLIKLLNSPEISIITIEDPIEYAVAGVRQIQTNARTGLTFGTGLRSILRQDPNVIMVGEIRDRETASIAVNCALTGHLLLSTLHTNDAATTLPRLLDMGVEEYLVASTISIAIGQRLVRKMCKNCTGKKCEACNNSGFKGRTSINEVLVADDEIREAILRKASSKELKNIAVKNGMTTMLEDGMRKTELGETTMEEVLRAVNE